MADGGAIAMTPQAESLQAELDAFKAAWVDRVGPEAAAMMAADIESLAPQAAKALQAGDQFPSVALTDHRGQSTDIAALAADQPVVVTFYRGGWCPYCNMELRAFQQAQPAIERMGARLVAVSPETPDNTLSTAEKNDLAFTVLSDSGGRLADALGIRFPLSPEVKAYFVKAGHDLPVRNAEDGWSLPMPATYVVAKGGRIALAEVDPDYRKRLEPQAVLDALASLAEKATA
jgi:peroxiredoxin